MNTNSEIRECAVCLQTLHHPAKLTCGHIFCFLCVKGLALQSKKCAMCRAEISLDYLSHPVLLKYDESSNQENYCQNIEYQWYYEGRNGWWKYDERSNIEIEDAYNAGEGVCSLLLAGAVYNIDFPNMIQVRRNDPTRRRRIKRDTPLLPAKGIAGIKTIDENLSKDDSNITDIIDLTVDTEQEDNESTCPSLSSDNESLVNENAPSPAISQIDIVDAMSAITIQSEEDE